jgi:hypothetical protein
MSSDRASEKARKKLTDFYDRNIKPQKRLKAAIIFQEIAPEDVSECLT